MKWHGTALDNMYLHQLLDLRRAFREWPQALRYSVVSVVGSQIVSSELLGHVVIWPWALPIRSLSRVASCNRFHHQYEGATPSLTSC